MITHNIDYFKIARKITQALEVKLLKNIMKRRRTNAIDKTRQGKIV